MISVATLISTTLIQPWAQRTARDQAYAIRTDLAATFFGLLALLFCLELAARPSLRVRILAGLAAGLALSSRYFMVAVLPVLPLAELAEAVAQLKTIKRKKHHSEH